MEILSLVLSLAACFRKAFIELARSAGHAWNLHSEEDPTFSTVVVVDFIKIICENYAHLWK